MDIKADGFTIRELRAEDRFELKKWRDFDDPLLFGYNYSDMTDYELSYWFSVKQFPFRSKYFAVVDEKDFMFCYLGMKEINRFNASSKLGIVMESSYVSKGYGYRILKLFLDYYFLKLNMKRMVLEVNEWNSRAIKLYEKLGFSYYGHYLQKFENQYIDLDDKKYDHIKDSFVIKNKYIYNRILKMSLTKELYLGDRDEN
ncbi:MAG: GNAT family protein [Tissierellia bacterium]|nr:GNAT family protein [Tissierellia bacterium]